MVVFCSFDALRLYKISYRTVLFCRFVLVSFLLLFLKKKKKKKKFLERPLSLYIHIYISIL